MKETQSLEVRRLYIDPTTWRLSDDDAPLQVGERLERQNTLPSQSGNAVPLRW